MKITVEIDNITEAQAIALEDMFAKMVTLGNIGGSRWVAFFSDGDGNFRPKIKVNGNDAKDTDIIDTKKLWKPMNDSDVYKMDFDSIAWALDDEEHMNEVMRKRREKNIENIEN